eukprot:7725827-Pyramimonas_sp.AAC.1
MRRYQHHPMREHHVGSNDLETGEVASIHSGLAQSDTSEGNVRGDRRQRARGRLQRAIPCGERPAEGPM